MKKSSGNGKEKSILVFFTKKDLQTAANDWGEFPWVNSAGFIRETFDA